MKAGLNDPAALDALGLLDVAAYLRSNGWKQVDRLGDKATVWQLVSKGEEYEILLPLRRDLADFVARMRETLRTLELAEQRSLSEIVQDLTIAPADVIRFRSRQPDTQDGTIPIDDGLQLVRSAREMLLAAACASIQPKPYFPPSKPAQVSEYMEQVRLGQTERGSFVVTLLSRVPQHLEPTKNGQAHLDIEDPFERRVTLTLAKALVAVSHAAEEAALSGSFAPFDNAVSSGVSANLCEAIATMAGGSAEARDLDISFTWSRLRPLESPEPRQVSLSTDAIPVIQEAGRVFREKAPRDDFELSGFVVGLQREEPKRTGKVMVGTSIDGAPRKVNFKLSGAAYILATEAHRDGKPVRCQGQLVRTGHLFELQKPHGFELVDEA